jgi:EAL and modified HD-GYP domain-containing signal transduction protein
MDLSDPPLDAVARRLVAAEPLPLDVLRLGYHLIVARDRRPIGTRITVASSIDAPLTSVLNGVLDAMRSMASVPFPHGLVVLAPAAGAFDSSAFAWRAPRNVLLELWSQALEQTGAMAAMLELHRNGVRTVLRLGGFGEIACDRPMPVDYVMAPQSALGAAHRRGPLPALWATDVRRPSDLDEVFGRGAAAVIGWPLEPEATGFAAPNAALQPTQIAVLELIRKVQRDADVAEIERAFKSEPVLGYLLLTLVNTPAFATSRPVASLAQAIMLVGYHRLARWLVLLLVIASKESRVAPLVFLSVVRAFFLEELASARGLDTEGRDEWFITGAFSLLDRITGRTFAELLDCVRLPDDVAAALRKRCGPYARLLALAECVESGDLDRAESAAVLAGANACDVNSALLAALATADALQGTF